MEEVNLGYVPHSQQQVLHDDKHRYLVVCAGRRSGKSKFARMHCLLNALYSPGVYWIVSPTYRQGKLIHWHELKKEVPEGIITYKNEQELSIHLKNGSRIELKGADNEDSLRGVGLKGVVMDEAADQKPHVWEEIIRPMLIDSGGWAVFIGTPKGFNWFFELFEKGRKESNVYDKDWASYQFTSYENPYDADGNFNPVAKAKEINKAKSETDDDTFAQEYMAQFKRFKGLIYKGFSREVHVVSPFDFSEYDGWEVYRTVDFGYGVNPTACLWVAVSPDDKWYLIDEYYETRETSDYHCGMIMSKSAQYPPTTAGFADPSNPQMLELWAKNGVYLTKAVRTPNTNLREWVSDGIDIIAQRLKVSVLDQKPRLFVFKNCENTIREFEVYRWKEEKDETTNKHGIPEKANDHCMDALRYFAVSYRGKQRIYLPPDDKNWSFT